MTARAIVTGAVFREPAQRTARSGRPYAVLTIKSGVGETVRWWKCFAFSETAIADVMELLDGEPVSVSGEFAAEIYAPAGQGARINWKIVADAVLSTRQRPRERRPKAGASCRPALAKSAELPLLDQKPAHEFNDDIPF